MIEYDYAAIEAAEAAEEGIKNAEREYVYREILELLKDGGMTIELLLQVLTEKIEEL